RCVAHILLSQPYKSNVFSEVSCKIISFAHLTGNLLIFQVICRFYQHSRPLTRFIVRASSQRH
ncbi:hypothetical protein, partial [Plesiomonas shigelloides]|uniref:hypothetical protein n=1 Tax=Plesiomonas shigelloides TaxID=703 RepID=UPI001C49AF05